MRARVLASGAGEDGVHLLCWRGQAVLGMRADSASVPISPRGQMGVVQPNCSIQSATHREGSPPSLELSAPTAAQPAARLTGDRKGVGKPGHDGTARP